MTFCHSLSSRLQSSSLLDPKLGWRDTVDEDMKVQVWETFMYYVRSTQHSVFGGRWCRTTLALPLTLLAPFAALHSFFGLFPEHSVAPALPLHPTWVTPTLQGSGGGGDTEQEGGRKANGGIVERTRLRKKCESDSSCVVNSTSFLSPIQSHSLCYL